MPPLVFSLRTCIFEHFVIFFVKFTRIQRWNRLIHTVLACAKFQRDFHFYKVNFDWFMCCKMCDLIASRKCHPPKHVLRKSVSIKTEVSKQPFPLFVMLLERYVLWKHLIFFVFSHCHLNTREAGRILKSFANLRLRLRFAYMPRQPPRV